MRVSPWLDSGFAWGTEKWLGKSEYPLTTSSAGFLRPAVLKLAGNHTQVQPECRSHQKVQHTVIFVWVHLNGTFDCVPCMHEFMTPDSRVGQALKHAILELPLQAPVDSDPVWKTPARAASQPRAVTHCWAMAKLPPAEQWCVCGVGQPQRRCQDIETLQPTHAFGAAFGAFDCILWKIHLPICM